MDGSIDRLKKVHSKAAQVRLRAMQTQLKAAFNFCLTAETAIVLGRTEPCREAIENARRTGRWVRVHLDEPNHVPEESVPDVRDRLAELERRLSDLEATLQP